MPDLATILETLDRIEGKVNRVLGMELGDARREKAMARSIDKIVTEVEENTDVIESASALIESLAQQIRDANGDEAKLEKLASDLDRSNTRLAEAVAANTPFDPSGNFTPSGNE